MADQPDDAGGEHRGGGVVDQDQGRRWNQERAEGGEREQHPRPARRDPIDASPGTPFAERKRSAVEECQIAVDQERHFLGGQGALPPPQDQRDVGDGQPHGPLRREIRDQAPAEDEDRPGGEQLVRIGPGLVDLAEDGEEDADQDAGADHQDLPVRPLEPAQARGADQGDDADLYGGELRGGGDLIPVEREEVDHAREHQHAPDDEE